MSSFVFRDLVKDAAVREMGFLRLLPSAKKLIHGEEGDCRKLGRVFLRHGVEPGDAKLKALDLQYHDLRADKCLAARVGLETLVDEAAVRTAMTEPPTTTRAYFRGKCLQKWPGDIVAANWDSLVFDIGRDPLRRVPMMEPLRGTREHVGRLIEECNTAAELLTRLGS